MVPPAATDANDNQPHPSIEASGRQSSTGSITVTSPPHAATVDHGVDEDDGTAAPLAADAPLYGVPVTVPVVATTAACLFIAIVAPLAMSDRSSIDRLALLCLLPAAVAALVIAIFKRDTVHFRQVFLRFSFGWMLLTPMSWLTACLVIMVWLTVFVIVLSNFLPPLAAGLVLYLGIFASIVTMEEVLQWVVLTHYDQVNNLPNPSLYPWYSSATAMGMGSASSYYLILFLRSLVDAAIAANCSDRYYSSPAASPSAPHTQGPGDFKPVDDSTAARLARAMTAATAAPDSSSSNSGCDGQKLTSSSLIVIIVVCVLLLQPMQCLANYHLGLVVARIHVLKHDIRQSMHITPIVLARTLFFFGALVCPLMWGPVGFLVPVLTLATYALSVKYYERNMPRDYLSRVGYLNLFGYGALPQDDDEATAGPPIPNGPSAIQPADAFPPPPGAHRSARNVPTGTAMEDV
jgi:hypothetical protein